MATSQDPPSVMGGDVQRLLEALPRPLPLPVVIPGLVIVSGLPGTGKSHFAWRLAQRAPLAVVESDAMRRALVASPTYSAEESVRLFSAIHQLIEVLLTEGIPVLLDATTLLEAHREPLYQIAQRRRAWIILAVMVAPPPVVHRRLNTRHNARNRQDSSEADWDVYERMRFSQEPISRPHYRVDTTRDIGPALDRVVREVQQNIQKAV